jgi:hypothetical protein
VQQGLGIAAVARHGGVPVRLVLVLGIKAVEFIKMPRLLPIPLYFRCCCDIAH